MATAKKKKASGKGVSEAQFKKIALSFPEAHEKSSYGSPAIFIAKAFFTRLRKEDNSLVLKVGSMEQRDMMLELDPKTYHITDHYKDYPCVLVRADRITPEELKLMLERRWRAIAPKKLVKAMDDKTPLSSPASARTSRVRGKGTQAVKIAPAKKAKKKSR